MLSHLAARHFHARHFLALVGQQQQVQPTFGSGGAGSRYVRRAPRWWSTEPTESILHAALERMRQEERAAKAKPKRKPARPAQLELAQPEPIAYSPLPARTIAPELVALQRFMQQASGFRLPEIRLPGVARAPMLAPDVVAPVGEENDVDEEEALFMLLL